MKKNKQRFKLPTFLEDGRLRYVAAIMTALALIDTVIAISIQPVLGLMLLLFLVGLVGAIFYSLATITTNTNEYISHLAYRIKRGEQEALIKMPVGILLYDDKMTVEWVNPYLLQYFGDATILGQPLAVVDADLAKLITTHQDANTTQTVTWGERQFDLIIQKSLGVAYLMDVTKYKVIAQQAQEDRIAIGQIYIDNYDEMRQTQDDQVITNLNSYVTNQLAAWADKYGVFVKRIASDRFLMIAYIKAVRLMERDRFNVLDKIREDTTKLNLPLTLSIGVAYGDDDLSSLATTSQNNLDLALGRGGDQVVVREVGQQARFFGGKTNPMEKRTRVRARMIAQALQELLKPVDQVFVMGHSHPDMDAIGAALGIRRIVAMNGRPCSVVVDQNHVHTDVARLMSQVAENPDIAQAIVTPEEAIEHITPNSMLVMVDHSKPSIAIAPKLYAHLANRTVIIDHHRRGEEFPEDPMLVYIEPYASSTCELITEMLEYQPTNASPLNKLEATAMLAGITVDTKSFTMRTGTRTFDAASYLKAMGADANLAQNLLRESVDSYLKRNHLIDGVEMVAPNMALCTGEETVAYDPVIAAQAADTLLSLSGIEAAFVIIRRPDQKIGISARSLGDINVQVVMERLGGGGHLSNAATQIEHKTVTQVKQELLAVIEAVQEDN